MASHTPAVVMDKYVILLRRDYVFAYLRSYSLRYLLTLLSTAVPGSQSSVWFAIYSEPAYMRLILVSQASQATILLRSYFLQQLLQKVQLLVVEDPVLDVLLSQINRHILQEELAREDICQ